MNDDIYGRDALIDRVARSEAPLTVLTGLEGVGKSEVLRCAAAQRDGWLCARQELAPTAGAVQYAVQRGLRDLVADAIDSESRLTLLCERLVGAAERQLSENLKELGKALGLELLQLVRSRLGSQFGSAIAGYVQELQKEVDSSLSARLAAAADVSIAEVLAGFSREVVDFCDPLRLAIYLDGGQDLNDEQVRLLADLANRVPPNLHLKVCFATESSENRSRVRSLCAWAPAAFEIEVPPLDEAAVSHWMHDSGLVENLDNVRAATGFLPLYVKDMIREGGLIADLPMNQQIQRRVERSWQQLGNEAHRAARALAVLPVRLPDEQLATLLEVDDVQWGQIVEDLTEAGFFTDVSGAPWFHDQRRRFVLGRLQPSELDSAATRAAQLVWEALAASDESRLVSVFAQLASQAVALRRSDPKLDAVFSLDESAHAVMAALIELQTDGRDATEAEQLFLHARYFTDLDLDVEQVLDTLTTADLVVTASNNYATVVLPNVSGQAVAAIVGLAFDRLTRTPIPVLANLMFELAMRPLMGSFNRCAFGMGSPSVPDLAEAATTRPVGRTADNRQILGNVRASSTVDPGLLVRGTFAGRPVWFVPSFDSESDRDDVGRVLPTASASVAGYDLVVSDVRPFPERVVPSLRFATAAARAFGLSPSLLETNALKQRLEPSVSPEARRDLRLRGAQLLRERSSEIERVAMELDVPYAIYWDTFADYEIDCLVYGGLEEARRVDGLAQRRLDRRYEFYQLARELGLEPPAGLRRLDGHLGDPSENNPVLDEIEFRKGNAQKFNASQPKMHIEASEDAIGSILRDGFVQHMEDSRLLATLVPRPRELEPIAVYALANLPPPRHGAIIDFAGGTAVELPSSSGVDEFHFALVTESEAEEKRTFKDIYGFGTRERGGHRMECASGVSSLLAKYAGLSSHDVWLDPA